MLTQHSTLRQRLIGERGAFGWRWGLRGVALVVAVYLLVQSLQVFVGLNDHTVIAGRFYRCSQPSASDLSRLIERKQIRTVVNLRGTQQKLADPRNAWFRNETIVTHDANVSQEDITLSAYLLPPPAEIRRLVEVLDRSEQPILIHCKQGADRTGLAAALVRLLHTDDTIVEARRELWPIYGHFALSRTVAMDQFLDRYELWLTERGEPHSADRLRHWVNLVYSPGPASSKLEWLDVVPMTVAADKPFALRLRATNTSTEPWHFEPGNHAAMHLLYKVSSGLNATEFRGQAGLLRKTVAVGESIEFMLAVPPLKTLGSYTVVAELIDARGCGVTIRSSSFVKFGDAAAMALVLVK